MLELRPITDDEFEALLEVLYTSFGEDPWPEAPEYERRYFEVDRGLAAFADGEMVASAGAYSFELTLPGGVTAPAAGVTWVGVLPTHRRRGILRSMMDRQLADIAERGEPLAVLTASEGGIYGRFGYGVAAFDVSVDLATRAVGLRPEPDAGGRMRLLRAESARTVLPGIDDATRRQRPGLIKRSDGYWTSYFTDPSDGRDGASGRYYAVHEDDGGRADGYVAYRIRAAAPGDRGLPGHTVITSEFRAEGPEIEAALCRYLLDIDLVATLTLGRRPLDDPLRFRVTDVHRYRVTSVGDGLWVRLVDIAAALAARRYGADGSIVLGVRDPFRPANDGPYRLEAGREGAGCRRAPGADPDVSLDVDALGSAYLGGVTFTALAAAGRAAGDRRALLAADALFTSNPLPFADLPF